MPKLYDRVKMTTATTGTGTITLASAAVGFRTFADAGVSDGEQVVYVIEENDEWEIGTGTYSTTGPTLSRTVQASSNAGAAIGLQGAAVVFVSATAAETGIPVGSIIWHAGNTPPTSYLKANGAAVSRTAYAPLFAAIGTTYGTGDGSTTFNLPDLRGEFLRGWDDSRGVDSGRVFGSAQGDAIRNMTGSIDIVAGGFRQGVVSINPAGVFDVSTPTEDGAIPAGATNATARNKTLEFDASNQVSTASENRPRNIALLACIKY